MVLNRARCDCLSRTNDVMSSANMTNFNSFPPTTIPLSGSFLRTEIASSSSTMLKRDGESGSPLQTPRWRLKKGVEKPLFVTELDTFLKNVLIPAVKDSPKPKDSSDFKKKILVYGIKGFLEVCSSHNTRVASVCRKIHNITYRSNCVKDGSSLDKSILIIMNDMAIAFQFLLRSLLTQF